MTCRFHRKDLIEQCRSSIPSSHVLVLNHGRRLRVLLPGEKALGMAPKMVSFDIFVSTKALIGISLLCQRFFVFVHVGCISPESCNPSRAFAFQTN